MTRKLKFAAVIPAILGLTAFSSSALASEPTWPSQSNWDIPGEYVIDYRDDVDLEDIDAEFKSLGVSYRETDLANETKIEVIDLGPPTSPGKIANVLNYLRDNPRVKHVEPNAIYRILWTPNDPMLEKQWHMDNVGAHHAWQMGIGRGVTVAVIDTGVACGITDLQNTHCVEGYDFSNHDSDATDDHGHGTHVAGTIAQSTNNSFGAAGLAFGANIMPIKVLSASGSGTMPDIADGIRWATDHGAQVINMSLGGPSNSQILQDAIDYAVDRNVVVVAAAGNSGGSVRFPGACNGVIGVSATNEKNELAPFSSRGTGVDIAAPGVNVTQQTICENGKNGCEEFGTFNGTSMASPHVAGVAAMLIGSGVTNNKAVEQALYSSAREPNKPDKLRFGAGHLQADSAMNAVHFKQVGYRLAAFFALTYAAFTWTRKRGEAIHPKNWMFWLSGLATSAGLLFFLPWLFGRQMLWADLVSRPLADLDLLYNVNLHKYLPLANAGVPLVLVALFHRVRPLAGLLGGVSVGTAGYLTAAMVLGQIATPFGWLVTMLWCGANVAACLYLSSLVLLHKANS